MKVRRIALAVLLGLVGSITGCSGVIGGATKTASDGSAKSTIGRTVPLTEPAIREALQEGGVINLPAGTVNITRPLRVMKSGTKLRGAGRDATVLRMAFGPTAFGPLLALPAEWSTDFAGGEPPPEKSRVSDVEIADLTIDGAREGNPNTFGGTRPTSVRFGIQSTVSTNTWIHDVRVSDVAGDAIAFGNGSGVNLKPRVEDVLVERAGRNGIHLGSTEDAAIRRTKVLDTPGAYWSDAGAGNGIDIEVEGHDPHVFRTVIEDNEISRPSNPGYAGFGIQITRAFGDVDDVLVQRNTFRNYQEGVVVSNARNVRILDNEFLSSPIGENNVSGGGIGLIGWDGYNASTLIKGNTFRLEAWRFNAQSIIAVDGPGTWTVTDNVMLGGVQTFRSLNAPSHVISARNRWKTYNNGPFYAPTDPARQTITDTGSTQLP